MYSYSVYHPYLVSVTFGMPSLYPFQFLMYVLYIHTYTCYLCIQKTYSKTLEQRTHWGQANCREVVLFSEVSIGKSLKTKNNI